MNYKALFFILIFGLSSLTIKANQIPFAGKSIEIIGTLAELTINEGNIDEIDIKHQLSKNETKAYTIRHNGTLTTIQLNERIIYNISVPPGTNVTCQPIEVAGESGWYKEQNNYQITLLQLKGEVILNADGYDVQLDDVTGSTSIVTYGDIQAKYSNAPTAEMISLDTYQGNITVQLPENCKANIKATARKGNVSFFADSLTYDAKKNILKANESVQINQISDNKIQLHSEAGSFIKVETNKDPTHPELRDKLIKLFIRDQGKNGMATGSRLELNKLGFEDYINQQPDIRPFTGSKLAEELTALIDKHGFPTPEMVGNGFAMSGVQMVLFNSSTKYMDKFKDNYKKYWPKMLEIYYSRGNGKF